MAENTSQKSKFWSVVLKILVVFVSTVIGLVVGVFAGGYFGEAAYGDRFGNEFEGMEYIGYGALIGVIVGFFGSLFFISPYMRTIKKD